MFIEVTWRGEDEKALLNVLNIKSVIPSHDGGTEIEYGLSETFFTRETYDQIKEMLMEVSAS